MVDSEESEGGGADEMDALMEEYLGGMPGSAPVGQTIEVPIVAVRSDHLLVDVGNKSEGMIDLREVSDGKGGSIYKPGDRIEAVVKGHSAETGMVLLSHQEARRRRAQREVEEAFRTGRPIEGRVASVVKGGLVVDIGLQAFMPASQVDIRRVDNFEPYVGRTIEAAILEYHPEKRRVILSRRQLLEAAEKEARGRVFDRITPGEVMEVTVKRIVDFGVFADLGGMDGLIPRGELSYNRAAKPEDLVKPGDKIQVRVLDANRETGKVTLSLKQVKDDPWSSSAERYPAGTTIEGPVVSIAPYGAFVRLEEGIDGMIHVSDMAWDSAGRKPQDYLSPGQTVSAQVLSVDQAARRISLGLKQLTADPWTGIEDRYPPMTPVKGKITGLTKYGAFLEIEPGIEGMIHVTDFSWDKRVNQPRDVVNKGDEIEACVLKVDREGRRISLGVKQLTESPIKLFSHQHKVGAAVEGEIVSVTEFGVFVKLAESVEGFIHISQLEKERVDSPGKLHQPGQTIVAEIAKIDFETGKVTLNRRTYLKKMERKDIQAYKDIAAGGARTNLGELLSELSLGEDASKKEG